MHARVIVVGGGIGGLSAAIALRQRGCEVQVIEQAEEIRPLGAGLSLWSNAMQCLQKLGLAERLLAQGSIIARVGVHRWDGRRQTEFAVAQVAARFGAPSMCALRSDLQRALLDALPADAVQLNRKLESFDQTADRVQVRLIDGSILSADMLVGADGLHSTVRRQLFDDGNPQYQGYGGVLGVAPLNLVQADMSLVYIGPGSRIGILPCGPGRVYWFYCSNRKEPLPDVAPAHKQILLDRLQGWAPLAVQAVENTPEGAMMELSFRDRSPRREWSVGRVTLLGDAAHPMTPILGQGACQALEDGLALAWAIQRYPTIPEALAAYERARIPRTTRVVNTARRLGRVAQWENRWLCRLRNGIATWCPRWLQNRQMAWQFRPSIGPEGGVAPHEAIVTNPLSGADDRYLS